MTDTQRIQDLRKLEDAAYGVAGVLAAVAIPVPHFAWLAVRCRPEAADAVCAALAAAGAKIIDRHEGEVVTVAGAIPPA